MSYSTLWNSGITCIQRHFRLVKFEYCQVIDDAKILIKILTFYRIWNSPCSLLGADDYCFTTLVVWISSVSIDTSFVQVILLIHEILNHFPSQY